MACTTRLASGSAASPKRATSSAVRGPPLPFAMPGWLGSWFEIYGTYETIACQLAAAILVVGSYVLAEQMKVRRPARRGAAVARRPETPPVSVT